jgi:acid phosphatase
MKFNLRSSIAFLFLAACFSCNNASKNNNTNTGNENVKLPKPDHIVILMEENHGYDQIIGSSLTPFINSLAEQGASFTNAHGLVHPSQPNYIGLFSGSLQGMKDDHCIPADTPYTTPNLGVALINAGYSFAGYAQTMPYPGFTECNYERSKLNGGHLYGRKHCPWVNWQGAKENGLNGDSVSFPMSKFPSDFNKLPTVAMVIPDMDHDMHNNGGDTDMIRMADEWAKDNLSKYIDWAKSHNSLFILTYDEDNDTWENRIPTIFVGPMVNPGKYNDSINLYNILRTIEHMYSLPPSGDAKAGAIANVWK